MRNDDIERELDGALARYAAVEPRDGLEQRVLANLRARAEGVRRPKWLAMACATTAAAIVAVLLIWAEGGHSARAVHDAAHSTAHEKANADVAVAAPTANSDVSTRQLQGHSEGGPVGRSKQRVQVAAPKNVDSAPKLAQFPAPEPLTEQEKLLIQFVEQDPQGAALFAEVRARELQRESEEMSPLGDKTDLQQGQTY